MPTITSQPENTIISTGEPALFSVSATGTDLEYQWYQGLPPDISQPVGNGSSTLTTPPLMANARFWCRGYNAGPTVVDSMVATATVVTALVAGATNYTTIVQTVFPVNFSVTATDSDGNPVPGVLVYFFSSGSPFYPMFASGKFPGGITLTNAMTDTNGVATAPPFTANLFAGDFTVAAEFETITNLLPAKNLATITSPAAATFLAGLPNGFNVVGAGYQVCYFSESGQLPPGVVFSDTGMLSGGPPAGTTNGVYHFTVYLTNQPLMTVTQDFTLTVVDRGSLSGQVTFRTNGAGWAFNNYNESLTISNDAFAITKGLGEEASSAWFRYPIYLGAFQASFQYIDAQGGGADGMGFVVQNATAETRALGKAGGGLGYCGISRSVGFLMNLYAGAVGGPSGVMLGTNGIGAELANGSDSGRAYASTQPVNLDDGNPIHVNLLYLGGVLQAELTDLATGATFRTNYTVNIPQMIGTNVGYVGLTGGDGAVSSTQIISNFSFNPLPSLSTVRTATNSVVFSWPDSVGYFKLQLSRNLSSTNWITLNPETTDLNGEFQVVVPTRSGSAFYRLVLEQ